MSEENDEQLIKFGAKKESVPIVFDKKSTTSELTPAAGVALTDQGLEVTLDTDSDDDPLVFPYGKTDTLPTETSPDRKNTQEAAKQAAQLIAFAFARIGKAYAEAVAKDPRIINEEERKRKEKEMHEIIIKTFNQTVADQLKPMFGQTCTDLLSEAMYEALHPVLNEADKWTSKKAAKVGEKIVAEIQASPEYKERVKVIKNARQALSKFIETNRTARLDKDKKSPKENMLEVTWQNWNDVPDNLKPAFFDLKNITQEAVDISQTPDEFLFLLDFLAGDENEFGTLLVTKDNSLRLTRYYINSNTEKGEEKISLRDVAEI